jgi:hypothetical protein
MVRVGIYPACEHLGSYYERVDPAFTWSSDRWSTDRGTYPECIRLLSVWVVRLSRAQRGSTTLSTIFNLLDYSHRNSANVIENRLMDL